MINDELRETVAAAFNIPADQVTEDSSGETIPQWDSVGHINLVMALEERLKVSFTVDEIMTMRNVAAIRRVVEGKSSSGDGP
jgi:acyl carrier protein